MLCKVGGAAMYVMLRVRMIALGINTFVDELMLLHRLTDVKCRRCCALLSTSSVEVAI